VIDGKPSIDMPPQENVSVILPFEPYLENLSSSWPDYVSLASNPLSRSEAIELTILPWQSLADLDL